jgi:Holliday junction DNA helicase RuvB
MLNTLFDLLGITFILESFEKAKRKTINPEFYLKEVKPIKFQFRPRTLDEYIGQEQAKDLVRLTIEKIIRIKPCHILITGNKGCGKTTLATIIANQLGLDITYQIGGTFTMEALQDFILENEKHNQPKILFVDEIHNLDKKLGEYMYPLLEDFTLVGKETVNVRHFIFIGATTEKYTLLKKFSPLVDRCSADIVLEPYKAEDMKLILKQYNLQIYQAEISDEEYDTLSKNCRYTPRIALAMFDDLIISKNIKRVLNSRRIIVNSLTTTDIKILEHLAEIGKPIGEEALSIIAQVNKADFKLWFEPLLIQEGYMSRTSRGRIITEAGKTLLKRLENVIV